MNNATLSATLTLTLVLLVVGSAAEAQTRQTPNTLRLDEGARSAPAKLADVSWLAGHWVGEGLGGQADETWSVPAAGTMVGAFRLIENNKLTFSEYFILMEEADSLVLRLKHFDPLFNGWEAKDKFVEFKLVRVEGQIAYFEGLTYKIGPDGKLHAIVAMKKNDGTFAEGEFEFNRISADKPLPATANESGNDVDLPPIELPMNPDTVVLEYDQAGGFRMQPPGFERTPRLRVFADGKVLVGRSNPNLGEARYQLDEEELMELLRFVVNKNRFYEVSTESLERQIKATGRSIMVADAPSTVVKVELVRGKHEVSSYALMMIVNTHPEVQDLKKLDAIRKQLEKLRSRACLGDKTQASRFLKELNREFKRQHPGIGVFELEDLVNADKYADDKIMASFESEFVDEQSQRLKAKFMAGVTKVGNQYKVSFRAIPIKDE